ncbi:GPP34 family phosphoprotein [Ornithinimicrobium sufpigmenti]|uniref:GPP34 family phosphoprotein n=1 Tax=Ornithinimicrobium sufpigmenti TaxID=2508882 RepID=UPI0010362256|nr:MULTISPECIES: GPP34 family phosphoprotein [unclassified Ornithinimicrobium]
MLLGEELILLLLDDEKGTWLVRRQAVPRAVRVALLVELLARRTVALDDHGVLVPGLSGTTGGDQVLDRAAQDVQGKQVIAATDAPDRELRALLRRLRDRGVLRRGVVRRRRHLARDHQPEAAVRTRVLRALQVEQRPDRHTALLVALVHELDLLGRLFPEQDHHALTARAAAIAEQLREDQHYFPTTLQQDASAQARAAGDPGSTLEGIDSAFEVLEAVGVVLKLATLPLRVVGRILQELP